jgi:tetratricopeptide (TPR) repeat protein
VAKTLKTTQDELAELQRDADRLRDEWLRVVDPFGVRARGRADVAVELFTEWIRRDDQFAPAFVARGLTYSFDLGKHAKAFADIEDALRLAPKSGTALAAKAFVLFRSGDRTQARIHFSKARGLGRNESMVYMLQGRFHHETDEYSKAKADYRRAITLNPEEVTTRIWYADICATCPDERIRDADEALKYAQAVVEQTDEQRWDGLLAYSSALAESGQFDDAADYAAKAVVLAPDSDKDMCKQRLEAYRRGEHWRMSVNENE